MLRSFILSLLLVSVSAAAQTGSPVVQLSQIDAAIERASSTLAQDDPLRETLLKIYSETHAALESAENDAAILQSYTDARANALGQAESIQKQLSLTRQASPQADDVYTDDTTLDELEQLIQVARAELVAVKSRLVSVGIEIDRQPRRPIAIRTRLTELIGLISDLDSKHRLVNQAVDSGSDKEANLWLLQAQLANARTEKSMLDAELLSQPMRLELLNAQHDKAVYDARLLDDRVASLEKRAAKLRKGEAEQARTEAQLVLAGTEGKHALVRQLADDNAELTASFGERGTAIEEIHQQEADLRRRAEQLESDLQSIERKLEVVE